MALRKKSQKQVRNASGSQLSPHPHYPAHLMLSNIAALIARTGVGVGIAWKVEDASEVTLRRTRALVRLL
mgnify:CR=1 FL=1